MKNLNHYIQRKYDHKNKENQRHEQNRLLAIKNTVVSTNFLVLKFVEKHCFQIVLGESYDTNNINQHITKQSHCPSHSKNVN